MKGVILYQDPGEDATVEDRDVLVQRDAVGAALQRLGHTASCLACTLDLATARESLLAAQPDFVFNLVESLGGTDRLMTLATMLLDALSLPYTGSSTEAVLTTSNKLAAKRRLKAAGLPTPAWFSHPHRGADTAGTLCEPQVDDNGEGDRRWILKPLLEHASFGLDDAAVLVANDLVTLAERLRDRECQLGRPLFAEQFIEGREFNLSLLDGEVLPPAEIDFSAFPPGKPRIVGHQAKWDEASFEYQQTPRRFDFPAGDCVLLGCLNELAVRCWELFHLRGYARVDFRVDRRGQPWILEVNVNPCLSPDAGFAAAADRGGLSYDDTVQRILAAVGDAVGAAPARVLTSP